MRVVVGIRMVRLGEQLGDVSVRVAVAVLVWNENDVLETFFFHFQPHLEALAGGRQKEPACPLDQDRGAAVCVKGIRRGETGVPFLGVQASVFCCGGRTWLRA